MQGVYAAARIISRTARLPQPSLPQGTSGAELLLPQAAASPCETAMGRRLVNRRAARIR